MLRPFFIVEGHWVRLDECPPHSLVHILRFIEEGEDGHNGDNEGKYLWYVGVRVWYEDDLALTAEVRLTCPKGISVDRLGLALLEDWIQRTWGPRMIQPHLNR